MNKNYQMDSEAILNKYFLSSCPDGVLAFDRDKKILIWNPAMEKIFGIPECEAVGKNTDHKKMPAFFSDSSRTFVEEALRGRKFTITHWNESPYHLMLEITYFPLLEQDKEVIGGMAFFKEINKQTKLDKDIFHFQEQSVAVLETMNEGFVILDTEWRYNYINHHAVNLFRMPKEEMLGRVMWDVFPEIKVLSIYKYLHQVMDERLPLYFENYIPPINKWFENRAFPIETGIAVIFHDITHHKKQQQFIEDLNTRLEDQNKDLVAQEEELLAQQEDLRLSLVELEERNFELDQIIYKTSHDLRSPLSSVMGLVNLAKTEADGPTLFSYIILIENRIARLDEFVKSMLDFSKANRTPVEAERVDFNQLINHCFQSLEYLPTYPQINKEIIIEGGSFTGDPLRLRIIFTNIISNAIKYMNPYMEVSFLKINIQINSQFVHIEIRDNGLGIKAEYMQRIFDMFFRGTDKSEGSGLGLYIVKQTIEKLNGSITIESTEGKGTTTVIQIPNLEK